MIKPHNFPQKNCTVEIQEKALLPPQMDAGKWI